FARLDRAAPRHAILATNSSTLGNSLLAPATTRPAQCVNMHFFFPPLVMRLVEVVKGQWTSEATLDTTAELVRRIGREPVVLRKELPGFLVNRILRALGNEAYYLLEQDVAPFWEIDKAVELGLNFPMGPFRLGDLSGLDIGYNARLETYESTKDPRDRPPAELEKRLKRGDPGRKTGRGYHDYGKAPPEPIRDCAGRQRAPFPRASNYTRDSRRRDHLAMSRLVVLGAGLMGPAAAAEAMASPEVAEVTLCDQSQDQLDTARA